MDLFRGCCKLAGDGVGLPTQAVEAPSSRWPLLGTGSRSCEGFEDSERAKTVAGQAHIRVGGK